MDETIDPWAHAIVVAREHVRDLELVVLRAPEELGESPEGVAQCTLLRGEQAAGTFWLLPEEEGRAIHGYVVEGHDLFLFPLRPAPGSDWPELLAFVQRVLKPGPPYPGAEIHPDAASLAEAPQVATREVRGLRLELFRSRVRDDRHPPLRVSVRELGGLGAGTFLIHVRGGVRQLGGFLIAGPERSIWELPERPVPASMGEEQLLDLVESLVGRSDAELVNAGLVRR